MEALHEAVRGISAAETRRTEEMVASLQQQVTDLQNQRAHLEAVRGIGVTEVRRTEEIVSGLQQQLTDLQSQRAHLEADVGSITQRLGVLEAMLDRRASELAGGLSSLQEQAASWRGTIEQVVCKKYLDATLVNMRDQLNTLRDEVGESGESMQEVVRGVVASEVRRGQEQIEELQDMQKKMRDLEHLVDDRSSELEGDLTKLHDLVAGLQSSLGKMVSEQQLDSALGSMQDQLSTGQIEERLRVFQRGHEQAKGHVTDIERRVAQKLSELESVLGGIQQQNASLHHSVEQKATKQQLGEALISLREHVSDVHREVGQKLSKQQATVAFNQVREQITNIKDVVLARMPEDPEDSRPPEDNRTLEQRVAEVEAGIAGSLPRIETLTQQHHVARQRHDELHVGVRGQLDTIMGRIQGIQSELQDCVSRPELDSNLARINERLVSLHGGIEERVTACHLEAAMAGVRENFAGLESAMDKKINLSEHEAALVSIRKNINSIELTILEKISAHHFEAGTSNIRDEIACLQTSLASKVSDQELRGSVALMQDQLAARLEQQRDGRLHEAAAAARLEATPVKTLHIPS